MVSIVFENTIERTYVGRMLPTLRQLHYLKLLAEHASFSRAAEAALDDGIIEGTVVEH